MTRTIEDLNLWVKNSHKWITDYQAQAMVYVEDMTPEARKIILGSRIRIMKRNRDQDNGFLLGLEWAFLFTWDELNPIWDDLNEHYDDAIAELEGIANEK